jgi:transcriptional regulator with XRE-family HTH domain
MRLQDLTTDDAILRELGQRLERQRVERNLSQEQMADEAGVGRATLQRLERGESVQMTSMVKVLRTLRLLDGLDAAIPERVVLPIAQLQRERGQRSRQRVRARRSATAKPPLPAGKVPAATEPKDSAATKRASTGTAKPTRLWTWGDERPKS